MNPWRLCVAPMLDWTDRHCRYFHRLLCCHARLYTEMISTGALLHGDVQRNLRYNAEEHPVALQLGGSEPAELAQCARLAQQWGYDEVNLNCGCPSARVQRGAFGACLMHEPRLVADCIKAMLDRVDIPVTVKHRVGIDRNESYALVRDFVGVLAQAGCEVFIVHARNAWLDGLSPKENREIPPLRYGLVHQLKRDFPHLCIVINGGLATTEDIRTQLGSVDGAMVGRAAYHDPWWLSQWNSELCGDSAYAHDHDAVESLMVAYMQRAWVTQATPWHGIARHMLGLRNGLPGARHWRRIWSDHSLRALDPQEVMRLAHRPVPA